MGKAVLRGNRHKTGESNRLSQHAKFVTTKHNLKLLYTLILITTNRWRSVRVTALQHASRQHADIAYARWQQSDSRVDSRPHPASAHRDMRSHADRRLRHRVRSPHHCSLSSPTPGYQDTRAASELVDHTEYRQPAHYRQNITRPISQRARLLRDALDRPCLRDTSPTRQRETSLLATPLQQEIGAEVIVLAPRDTLPATAEAGSDHHMERTIHLRNTEHIYSICTCELNPNTTAMRSTSPGSTDSGG